MTGGLAVVAAAALVTYATRVAGLLLAARLARGAPAERGRAWARADAVLAHVPVAAFAALVAPDLGLGGPEMLERAAGAAVAAAVVLRGGALWAGLGAGMGTYWAVAALVG